MGNKIKVLGAATAEEETFGEEATSDESKAMWIWIYDGGERVRCAEQASIVMTRKTCRWKECSKPQPLCTRLGKPMSQQEKRRREGIPVVKVNALFVNDSNFLWLQTTNKDQEMKWQDAAWEAATMEIRNMHEAA